MSRLLLGRLPRAHRIGRVAVAAALCLGGLAACQRGSATDAASCDAYQVGDSAATAASYPMLLIMLDVDNNSAATGTEVADRLRPYLDQAVAGGEYVRLVASGGENAPLTSSPCFTGQAVFKIDRRNATRQKKDRASAGTALAKRVDQTVQQVAVRGTGSVTGLLADASHEIESVRSTPGAKIGKVTVLVWSDLLGNTQGADCLNVNGQEASPAIAEALVRRCFQTGTLTSLGSDTVRFLGVNVDAGTQPQQDMARYLEGELCRRLSTDCV